MRYKLITPEEIMSLKDKEFYSLRETVKLALDAIQTYAPDYMHGLPKETYVKTLRAALAEPEQGCKQWQNLTDDEIKKIIGPWGPTPIGGYTRKLFDQIEAALREKNT